MRAKSDRIFLILFLAYLGMVVWCCFGHFDSLPKVQKDLFGIPTDKVVHFVMFLPFVFLFYMSFASMPRRRAQALLLALGALAAGALMAVATELGQSLTTYRSGDAWDFAADAAGLGVALVCVLIIIFTNKRLS